MKTRLRTILLLSLISLDILSSDVGVPVFQIENRDIFRPEIDLCNMLNNKKSTNLKLKNNYSSQKEAIVVKLMGHLSQIIDLKSVVTSYLEDNREIYGRYVSLKEQKGLLTQRIQRKEQERADLVQKAQENMASIDSGHGMFKVRKIVKALENALESDLTRINKDLIPAKDLLSKVEDEYFSVLSVWAPFQEYLAQLENLETNLMGSLEKLTQIESTTSNQNHHDQDDQRTYRRIRDITRVITTPMRSDQSLDLNSDWLVELRKRCRP